MNIHGIGGVSYLARGEIQKVGRSAVEYNFSNQLGDVQHSGGTFILHCIDMFAYSSYLENSGKCPGAQSAFIGASSNLRGADSISYGDLFGNNN